MSNATTAVAIGLALLGSGLGVASYTKSQRLEQALAARSAADSAPREKDDSANRGLEDRVRTLERQVARLSFGRAAGGPLAAGPAGAAGAAEAPGAAAEAPRERDPRIAKALEPEQLAKRLDKVKSTIKERWDKWSEQNGVPEKSRADFIKLLEDAAAKREELRLKRRNQDIDVATNRAETNKILDEVRSRSRELLGDDLYKKFEAERGPTAGTSWRDTRRALRDASRPAATAPAEGPAPAAP